MVVEVCFDRRFFLSVRVESEKETLVGVFLAWATVRLGTLGDSFPSENADGGSHLVKII